MEKPDRSKFPNQGAYDQAYDRWSENQQGAMPTTLVPKLWEKVIAHIHAWHEAGVSAAVSPYQQAECERIEAIMAAREAKAAQGQDGAVYCTPTEHEGRIVYEHTPEPIPMSDWFVLYTRPPVLALTNEKIREIMRNHSHTHQPGHYSETEFDCMQDMIGFARAIIKAAEGEKG